MQRVSFMMQLPAPRRRVALARLARDVLVRGRAEAEGLVQVVHGAVEGLHEFILELLRIRQVPAPPALFHASVVACAIR